MRLVVTCGPSYEPIDEVRRITNFSTGELGVRLANALASAGHEVVCFKGLSATFALPLENATFVPFSTNDDLREKLIALPDRDEIGAFFHIAALCDYRIQQVVQSGAVCVAKKVSSRAGEVTLTLEPATKLIGELRALFPRSRIVGWKYELEGSREEAIEKARLQVTENHTDACVINGAAYGSGFGWYEPGQPLVPCAHKVALCDWIANWLAQVAEGSYHHVCPRSLFPPSVMKR